MGEQNTHPRLKLASTSRGGLTCSLFRHSNSDRLGNVSEAVGFPALTVVCKKCCISGEMVASLNDVEVGEPTFRVDMKGLSARIDLDVTAKEATTFAIPGHSSRLQ